MQKAACAFGLFLAIALAADLNGKWTGDMPGRGGETAATTFTFKVDGEKLTGTMTGPQGEIPLQEGKVSGDKISFSTTLDFGGNSVKILYKGAVSGEQIKMSREREGGGQAREFTIKRAGT
jgi:hypothetical protein